MSLKPEIIKILDDMENHDYPSNTRGLKEPIQTIGWYAHRKAQAHKEETDFFPLQEHLLKVDKDKRDDIYYMLFAICANTNQSLLTKILESLTKEPEEKNIRRALSTLGNYNAFPDFTSLPIVKEADVDILLQWSDSENVRIRTDLWRVLKYASIGQSKIEKTLLTADFSDEYEREALIGALYTQGTVKSIPLLKGLMLRFKNKQILTQVVATIREIDGGNQIDYLIEQFNIQRNGHVKGFIATALATVNNPKAIPILIKRIKQILGRTRTLMWNYPEGHLPELCKLLNFLKQHQNKEESEISKLFKWLITKKMDKLLKNEIDWVKENIVPRVH